MAQVKRGMMFHFIYFIISLLRDAHDLRVFCLLHIYITVWNYSIYCHLMVHWDSITVGVKLPGQMCLMHCMLLGWHKSRVCSNCGWFFHAFHQLIMEECGILAVQKLRLATNSAILQHFREAEGHGLLEGTWDRQGHSQGNEEALQTGKRRGKPFQAQAYPSQTFGIIGSFPPFFPSFAHVCLSPLKNSLVEVPRTWSIARTCRCARPAAISLKWIV